jgi:hypothetical protein
MCSDRVRELLARLGTRVYAGQLASGMVRPSDTPRRRCPRQRMRNGVPTRIIGSTACLTFIMPADQFSQPEVREDVALTTGD